MQLLWRLKTKQSEAETLILISTDLDSFCLDIREKRMTYSVNIALEINYLLRKNKYNKQTHVLYLGNEIKSIIFPKSFNVFLLESLILAFCILLWIVSGYTCMPTFIYIHFLIIYFTYHHRNILQLFSSCKEGNKWFCLPACGYVYTCN